MTPAERLKSPRVRMFVALDLPEDVSLLVATDGTAPAASDISVSWPVDTATPWAGPLLLGGAVFLLIGLILYIWAFLHLRRQHGPRRKGPQGKVPRGVRMPRARAGIQSSIASAQPSRRRRLLVLPLALGATVLLAGCSSDYWPDLAAGATGTPTARTAIPRTRPVVDRRASRCCFSASSPSAKNGRNPRIRLVSSTVVPAMPPTTEMSPPSVSFSART